LLLLLNWWWVETCHLPVSFSFTVGRLLQTREATRIHPGGVFTITAVQITPSLR